MGKITEYPIVNLIGDEDTLFVSKNGQLSQIKRKNFGGSGGTERILNERVFGKIMNDNADSNFAGYGYAQLEYFSDNTVKVTFQAKLSTSSRVYSTFESGLSATLIHDLNDELPLIQPINDNSDIVVYTPSGNIDYSNMDYAYTTEIDSSDPTHWKIARYYTTDGGVGGLPSGTWGNNSGKIIKGVVYGTWEND